MSFTIRPVREKKDPPAWKKKLAGVLPMMLAGVAALRSMRSSDHHPIDSVPPRVYTLKRVWMWLVVILIVLLLIIGGMRLVLRIKEIAFGTVSLAAAELPVDDNGFTNVLLLGVGDKNHDGVDLTDTIMVASIDPKNTKSAFLLSLPRDLYALSTEKMGTARINSLYRDYKSHLIYTGMKAPEASKEALKELGAEIGRFVGLPIHGTIKVTFSGFTEAVDLLGGIDIVVPYDIVDTEYPGPNYSYQTFSIQEGPQHLDGDTALMYARSRHTTSDFSRSARQQQILSALSETALSQGVLKSPKKVMDMISILSKNIETTFSVRELLSFISVAKAIDTTRISGMQINDKNGLYSGLVSPGGFLYPPPREEFEGASVLLPVSVPPFPITWKQIRTFMSLVTQNRQILYAPVRIAVLNAGAREGAARILGGELIRYGFDVVRITNYGPRGTADVPVSFIDTRPFREGDSELLQNSLPWHAALLMKTLSIASGDSRPEAFTDDDGADLVIVLGEDYSSSIFQDLLGKE